MSKQKITPLKLEGTYLIETKAFIDHRGIFARFFCQNEMKEILGNRQILSINYSTTRQKGAIRGLHYQKQPFAETKMVRCIRGKILDIFVDVRKGSPTFLQWDSIELSAENINMTFIPEGFAHGLQSLEDDSEIIYFSSQFYSSEFEEALNIKDPRLNITLPLSITDISERDKNHSFIKDINFMGIKI